MHAGTDIWSGFCRVSSLHPERPALVQGDREMSFAELRARATDFAATLRADGVSPGSRCVVWAENSIEMAIGILGIIAAETIPTIVNAQSPTSHVLHACIQTDAAALVTTEAQVPDEYDGRVFLLDALAAKQPGASAIAVRAPTAGSPASILFTSGSTGLPKGVAQSHANLIWGAQQVAGMLGITGEDRLVAAVPWAFDYGWGQLLSTFLLGTTQVLPEKRGPFGLCEAIARHRPTVLPGVPSLFSELLGGMSPIRETDIGSIRLLTNTGSKIPAPVFAQITELFPDALISLNYGLTETYRSASLPAGLARTKPHSVGVALPGARISVLAEDGRVAAPGEKGEIVHHGAGVFLGYWGDPERTAITRRPDPLQCDGLPRSPAVFTGDIGWMDDDGHLHVEGRRDRQIKSMGVRVSPDEVESLIHATGLVSEVAVVGVPHDAMGQQVVALIVPRGDAGTVTRSLKVSARQTMSPFMRPMVWKTTQALPRNPNGKVDYPKILADLSGPPATQPRAAG